MKHLAVISIFLLSVAGLAMAFQWSAAQQPPAKAKQVPKAKGKGKMPAYQPTADEKRQMQRIVAVYQE